MEDPDDICIKLDYLLDQLNEIITLSKDFFDSGLGGVAIKELLSACEDVKSRIERFFTSKEVTVNDSLCSRMCQLKCCLHRTIETGNIPTNIMDSCKKATLACKFQSVPDSQPVLSKANPSSKARNKEVTDYTNKLFEKKNTAWNKKKVEIKTPQKFDMDTLADLKKHAQGVVRMAREYKDEGLLGDSVDKFIRSCEDLQNRIDDYTKKHHKLVHLKEQITKLENYTSFVNKSLDSASLSKFLNTCADFKDRLDDFKKFKPMKSSSSFDTLVSQISETIHLSKTAKAAGLLPDGMEDFIRTCENVALKLEAGEVDPEGGLGGPRVLDDLSYNIDDIIAYISKYRDQGLVSPSVEDFLRNCEDVRGKLEYYKRSPHGSNIRNIAKALCSGNCPKCNAITNVPKKALPSNSCPPLKEPAEDVCVTCFQQPSPAASCASCKLEVKDVSSQQKKSGAYKQSPAFSGPCCMETKPAPPPNILSPMPCCAQVNPKPSPAVSSNRSPIPCCPEIVPQPVDNATGYFENNVRKIIRVNRYRDKDGTIKEEKKTIRIQKQFYDPTITEMTEDTDYELDIDAGSVSGKSGNDKLIATCGIPQYRGFIKSVRYIKSEDNILNGSLYYTPILKRSMSVDPFFINLNEFEIRNFNLADMECISRKQNVLSKLVIPKIQKAIAYIRSELEEKEREETFRLKRFKQSKMKKIAILAKEKEERYLKEKGLAPKKEVILEPHIIIKPPSEINQHTEISENIQGFADPKPSEDEIKEIEEMILEEVREQQLEDINSVEPKQLVLQDDVKVKPDKETCSCVLSEPEFDEDTGKFICPICKLASEAATRGEVIKINIAPCQICLPEINEDKQRLQHLMSHVNQVMKMTKQYKTAELVSEEKEKLFSYATIKKLLEFIPYSLLCTCPRQFRETLSREGDYVGPLKSSETLDQNSNVCTCEIPQHSGESCPCEIVQQVEDACSCPSQQEQVGDILPEWTNITPTIANLPIGPRSTDSAYGCPPSSYAAAAAAYFKHMPSAHVPPNAQSLSYPPCPKELADRIAKASEPYLNRQPIHGRNDEYSVCQGDVAARIAKASAPYLKSIKQFSSSSSDTTYESQTHHGKEAPYSQDSAAYFTAIPQQYTPFVREEGLSSGGIPITSNLPNISEDPTTYITLVPDEYMYFAPYTSEPTPGPSGISEIMNTDPDNLMVSFTSATYTEEGGLGPSRKSNAFLKDFPTYIVMVPPQNTPFTREGKPGPCGISETVAISTPVSDQSQPPLAPYTRQGQPGPCGIPDFNTSTVLPDASIFKDSSSYVIMISKQYSPYTREGNPGPCGINKMGNFDGLAKTFKDTATFAATGTQYNSTLLPFTREGKPGPCGIFEMSGKIGLPETTTSIDKYSAPYTREGTPGPCGIFKPIDTRNINKDPISDTMALNSYQPREPYTREGKPGPCGYIKKNSNSLPTEKAPVTKTSTTFTVREFNAPRNPFSSERRTGAYHISYMNRTTDLSVDRVYEDVATYVTTVHRCYISSSPYTNEGQSGASGFPEDKNINEPSDVIVSVSNISTTSQSFASYAPYIQRPQPVSYAINSVNPVNSTTSLDIPSSTKPSTPYMSCLPSAAQSPDVRSTVSRLSTAYYTNLSSKLSAHYRLSAAPSIRSTVTVNYVICQSDIQAAIDKASAPYISSISTRRRESTDYAPLLPEIQAKIAMASVPYMSPGIITDIDSPITMNTDTYIVNGSSAHTDSLDQSLAAIYNAKPPPTVSAAKYDAPSGRDGTPRSTPESSIPYSSVPQWINTPNITAAPPSRPLPFPCPNSASSLNVFGDNGRPFLKATRSNSFPSITTKLSAPCKSPNCSIIVTPKKSSAGKPIGSLQVAPFVPCSTCGTFSNPSPKPYSSGENDDYATKVTTYYPDSNSLTPYPVAKAATPAASMPSESNPFSFICASNAMNSCPTEAPFIAPAKSLLCPSCGKIKKTPVPNEITASGRSTPCQSCSFTATGKSKLGYFETEFKEITKVTRYKNPDGTITDEKQIITIKTEKNNPRKPCNDEHNVGTCINCSEGYDNNSLPAPGEKIYSESHPCRNTKSDIVKGSTDVAPCPIIKRCLSAQEYCNLKYAETTGDTWTPRQDIDLSEYPNRLLDTDSEQDSEDYESKATSMTKFASCQIVASVGTCGSGFKRHSQSDTGNEYVSVRVKPKQTSGHVCCNRPKDTDSGPKCSCADMQASKPAHPVCPNATKKPENHSKCCRVDTSPSKPTCPLCGLELEEAPSEPKGSCADGPSCKPPPPVCPNMKKTESRPKCCHVDKSPPTCPVCGLRLEESNGKSKPNKPTCKPVSYTKSGTKCCLVDSSSSKSSGPVCGNRTKDTDSGAKCSCADLAASKPTCPLCGLELEEEESEPKCSCAHGPPCKPPPPVCPNMKKQKSRPKCCNVEAKPSKPTCPLCGLELEEEESEPKCSCAAKPTCKPAPPVCPNSVKKTESHPKCCQVDTSSNKPTCPVCGLVLEEKDSEPKCSCAEPPTCKPAPPICPNSIKKTESKPKCCHVDTSPRKPTCPACGLELVEEESEPKCNCAGGPSCKPPPPVCPNMKKTESRPKSCLVNKSSSRSSDPVCGNRSKDTDSGPKCSCSDLGASKSTCPVCGLELDDEKNEPKCSCADGPSCKPPPPVCPNMKIADSRPKCCLVNKSSKSSDPVCGNRSKDTDSGPKCSCAELGASKPTCPICALELEEEESEPKCSCSDGPSCKPPPPVCPNMKKTDSRPKSCLVNKSSSRSSDPVCGNRSKDTDSGPKCSCSDLGASKPTCPLCGLELEEEESEPKCSCADGPSCKPPPPVCPKMKKPESPPKCCHVETKPSKPTCPLCGLELEEEDHEPKCTCADGPPCKPPPPVCPNAKKKPEAPVKCGCPVTPTPPTCPVCGLQLEEEAKCKCADGPPCKPPPPVCPNMKQDANSRPKCRRMNRSSSMFTVSTCTVCPDKSFKYSSLDISSTPPDPVCDLKSEDKNNSLKCKCTDRAKRKHVCPGHAIPKDQAMGAESHNEEVCCPIHSESYKHSDLSYTSIFQDFNEQVCCKHRQTSNAAKAKCCLSTCPGRLNCPDRLKKFEPSVKNIAGLPSNNAYTSTTDLSPNSTNPKISHQASKSPSKAKNGGKESTSCCTIKIITKPPKTHCCDPQDGEEIVLKGSVVDVLRKMLLSSKSCTQHRDKPINKNICKTCYSPLTDSESDCSKSCPLCRNCQEKLEYESEEDYRCTYYGTDSGSQSLKSATSCCQKHSTSKGAEKTCYAVPKSIIKTTSDSCLKYTNSCCSRKRSLKRCMPKLKDAATSTRLSDRYDVRPVKRGKIEHACARIRDLQDCSCHSDSHMHNGCGLFKPSSKSHSQCDDFSYFYRW